VISGFRFGVNKICALLWFYAGQNWSLSPTFRDKLSISSSKIQFTLEDETYMLRQRREYCHVLIPIADFMNEWSCTSTPSYIFMA